jgi:hypothetical protein
LKPESLYTLSEERFSVTELSPERPERVTLLEARTAVEVLEEELLRVACPELLLLTEPSEEELLLLTVVPEALLLERVPEALDPLLEERVTCWLLLPEVLLVVLEEPEVERAACWLLPLEERVTCWLELPEVLLVEEDPEVERLTCWLLEELERDTEEAELERVAEEELDRETEEPELERVAWVEDDLVPLEERVWAIISGAATRDRAISTVAAIVIKRLIASNF